MPRALRPRAPLPVSAVLVTQVNCEAVLGVNASRYLEIVVPLCKGEVIEIGKLRAIPVDVVLERLRSPLRVCGTEPQTSESSESACAEVDADDFTSADQVLASIGMRATRRAG